MATLARADSDQRADRNDCWLETTVFDATPLDTPTPLLANRHHGKDD